MRSCKEIKHLLLDYLEGTLSKESEEMVRNHLYSCSDCRLHFESLSITAKNTEDILSNYAKTVDPPPYLWGKILKDVQKSKGKVAVSWWKVAVTTCAVIGVLLTGTLAPVFGYEGNLLNVISGSIIEKASDDLNNIISDDLLGSLRKEEILSQTIDKTGLTEELIWELEEKGYTEKDIVKCAKISESSNWSIEQVIEKRDKGFGFGRIANWAGVSVFSVPEQIAKPIRILKTDIEAKEEFEIDTEVAGFDENKKLISPRFPEPIHIPQDILGTDGNKVSQNEIQDSYIAVKFKLENGKLVPKQIRKHHIRPPKHFKIHGIVYSVENGIVTIRLKNNDLISAKVIEGKSNIFGEIEVGSNVDVFGFKSRDGKMFIDFIKPIPVGKEHLPPRIPLDKLDPGFKPPHPKLPIQKITIDKPLNSTDSDKEVEIEDNSKDVIDEVADNPTDTNTPLALSFTDKKAKITSVVNNEIITDIGSFNISDTVVFVNFKDKLHPISKSVLYSTDSIGNVIISGENNSIQKLIINRNSLTKTECLVVVANKEKTIYKVCLDNYDIKTIKANSSTIIQSNKEVITRGSVINLYRFEDIPDVAIVIENTFSSLKNIRGNIEAIDNQGIVIKGVKYSINSNITGIYRPSQHKPIKINPFDIPLGSEVEVTYSNAFNRKIALKVFVMKPGKNRQQPNNLFKIVNSEISKDNNKITLFLSKDNKNPIEKIIVTNKIPIFLEQTPVETKKIGFRQLLRMKLIGMNVIYEKSRDNTLNKLTIIGHRPPS